VKNNKRSHCEAVQKGKAFLGAEKILRLKNCLPEGYQEREKLLSGNSKIGRGQKGRSRSSNFSLHI